MCYQKSDELYGKKTVIENLGKTVGVLIGCLVFGRIIFSYKISYRACLIISILFNFMALFTLALINDNSHKKVEENSDSIIKYLVSHKALLLFLAYNCLSNMSYNIVLGLKMLMLTDFGNFSTNMATSFILIFCVLDIIFGALAIKILKSNNDYVNMSIKFLIRAILLMIVVITNNVYIMIVAMAYSLLTNIAYSNLIAGFMTNSIDNKFVLDFTVLNYITTLIGEAIGVFIAGIFYAYGFKYIALAGGIIMIIQLIMAYYIIYIKRKTLKHS